MSKYITQEIETLVLNNKPVVYNWTKEFHSGRQQLGYWISKQPRGTIKDARVVMSRNGANCYFVYETRRTNYQEFRRL